MHALPDNLASGGSPRAGRLSQGVYGLCELLRERIRSGHYGEEGRLPSEFVLVRELGVSRTRLRAALEILRNEGTLTRKRGHGTFAAGRRLVHRPRRVRGFAATVAARHLSVTREVLSASTWAMDPLTADDFGVAPGTPMHVVERLTRLNGEPFSLAAYVVRGDLAPGLLTEEFRGLDMRDWLATSSVVPLTSVDVTIEAVAADARAAAHLRCAEGTPLLRMNRHFLVTNDELLAFGSATMRGDRFTYQAARQPLDLAAKPSPRKVPSP
jgi:GntR family transcriptional regulator